MKKHRKKPSEKTIGKKKTAKTTENKQKIIAYISSNGMAKRAEINELLGLAEARTRELITEMVEEGLLEAVGDGRSRHYILPNK